MVRYRGGRVGMASDGPSAGPLVRAAHGSLSAILPGAQLATTPPPRRSTRSGALQKLVPSPRPPARQLMSIKPSRTALQAACKYLAEYWRLSAPRPTAHLGITSALARLQPNSNQIDCKSLAHRCNSQHSPTRCPPTRSRARPRSPPHGSHDAHQAHHDDEHGPRWPPQHEPRDEPSPTAHRATPNRRNTPHKPPAPRTATFNPTPSTHARRAVQALRTPHNAPHTNPAPLPAEGREPDAARGVRRRQLAAASSMVS